LDYMDSDSDFRVAAGQSNPNPNPTQIQSDKSMDWTFRGLNPKHWIKSIRVVISTQIPFAVTKHRHSDREDMGIASDGKRRHLYMVLER
jgi:hypothetical protein